MTNTEQENDDQHREIERLRTEVEKYRKWYNDQRDFSAEMIGQNEALRAKVEWLTAELAEARQLEAVNWDAMVEARRERDEALALLDHWFRPRNVAETGELFHLTQCVLAKHGRGDE